MAATLYVVINKTNGALEYGPAPTPTVAGSGYRGLAASKLAKRQSFGFRSSAPPQQLAVYRCEEL